MSARKKIQEAPKGLIIFVLILSALLNMIVIGKSAFIYDYYAATVYSMTQSFSNFLYVAFDPAGYISAHQAPLVLMVQTVFVKIFGFHSWVLCLPQMIAGVLACFIAYRILLKNLPGDFGGWAAPFGALVFAVTPAFVAISRSNMPDMIMILLLLLSAHMMLNAATAKNIWLMLLSAVLFGFAFNAKLNQVLIAAPAILLVCFLVPRYKCNKKFIWGAVFAAVSLIVSFGWMIFVDTTPSIYRPYAGGTNTNSAIEMSLSKYNSGVMGMDIYDDGVYDSVTLQNSGGKSKINPFGAFSAINGFLHRTDDAPGFFRLLSGRWYYQGSWMLLFSVIAMLAAIIYTFSQGDDLYGRLMVLFSAWLIMGFAVLSFTRNDLASFYIAMVSVPAAMCSAMGLYTMVHFYQDHRFWWILLPVSLLIASVEQAAAVASGQWAVWTIIFPAVCFLLALALFAARFIKRKNKQFFRNCAIFAIVASLCLVATSFVWSLTPMLYGGGAELPQAGPQLRAAERKNIPEGLLDYLEQNFAGSSVMVIVPSAIDYGSAIIKETGWSVVAAGGYDGRDHYITVDELQQMAQEKQVRYILVTGNEHYQGFMEWVFTRRLVPSSLWYTGNQASGSLPRLYDLWVPGVIQEAVAPD